MTPATADDIIDLLGDQIDDTIVERIASVGASVDEIGEAIDDLDYERRYGEAREPSTARVDEVRQILEELPYEAVGEPAEEEEEAEGLTVIEADELASS